MKMEEKDIAVCSFCGRMEHEDERFISGSVGGAICRECVDLCQEIVSLGRDSLGAEILSPERIAEMIESQGEGRIEIPEPGIGYRTRDDNRITTRGTTMQVSS
jgi:hypothetical protein